MDVIFKLSNVSNFVVEVDPNCSVDAIKRILEEDMEAPVQCITRATRGTTPNFVSEVSRSLYQVKEGGPWAEAPMDETQKVAYYVTMLFDVTDKVPLIAKMQEEAQKTLDAKFKALAKVEAEKKAKMAAQKMADAKQAMKEAEEAAAELAEFDEEPGDEPDWEPEDLEPIKIEEE